MATIKKKSVKTFIRANTDDKLFFQIWQTINIDGPLCPLPRPAAGRMSGKLECMRRQQVHVNEIKRLCHVPVIE